MRLLVIVPDYISAIIEKGEYQPLYYNPGELADEVHILMTNSDRPDKVALQRTVGRAQLYLHNLPEDHRLPPSPLTFLRSWRMRHWAKPGVEMIRRIKPDIIRCHGADWNAYLASLAKEELDIPYCVSMHINPDINPPRRYLKPLNSAQIRHNDCYEQMELAGLRNADRVLPVYKPILPYLKRMGVPDERVQVCYNVLNILHLQGKKEYTLHDPVRLLYVGRLFEEKNPAEILRAIAVMPFVKYTIVGDGPELPRLKKLSIDLGLADRVEFEPSVDNDELCRQMPGYDIFVIHTEYWELNKSLLEALLTGLPVIINRRKGKPVPELLEGNIVRFVDNSAESYGKAIQDLIRNHPEREALGRRAFAHARRRWDPKITEAVYVNVYKELLGKRNA